VRGGTEEALYERDNSPVARDHAELCCHELLGVALRVTQLAVVVDAASEEVVQEALLHLLQLGDELLGFEDHLVERVENLGDASAEVLLLAYQPGLRRDRQDILIAFRVSFGNAVNNGAERPRVPVGRCWCTRSRALTHSPIHEEMSRASSYCRPADAQVQPGV